MSTLFPHYRIRYTQRNGLVFVIGRRAENPGQYQAEFGAGATIREAAANMQEIEPTGTASDEEVLAWIQNDNSGN